MMILKNKYPCAICGNEFSALGYYTMDKKNYKGWRF